MGTRYQQKLAESQKLRDAIMAYKEKHSKAKRVAMARIFKVSPGYISQVLKVNGNR